MPVSGHRTYLPGNQWILNGTYPDENRLQRSYLYEVSSSRRVPLSHCRSPEEYRDEWRSDPSEVQS